MHRGIVGVCDLCELVTLSFCVLTLENCTKIVLFSCCFLCQSSPSLVTFFLFGFFFPFWTLSLLPNRCVEISQKKKNLLCCCQIIVKYLSTQQKSWVEENAARLLSLLTTNVVYCVAPSQTLHHLADPWLAPKSDEKFNKRPMFWTKQWIMLWEESFCKIQQVKGNVGENQAKHFTMTITENRFYSSFTDIIIYQSNLVYTYTHASP